MRRRGRRFAAGVCVILTLACAPPDGPPALDLVLPHAARTLLAPDSVRSLRLLPGVEYRYLWTAAGPWAVHLIQARIADRCDLGFSVLRPAERKPGQGGRETVSRMVALSGERVVAAVNADFFSPEGMAVGVEVVDGTVWSSAERPTFAWRPGEAPWMGIADVVDGTLLLGWPVSAPADGETEAVGGFPDLIDDGRRVGDLEVADRPTFAAARHPRSAVGYDADTGTVWLVVVDGRQPPHSVGMTLPELASLFEALGVEEALNLDGGGSTSLVIGGGPMNRPSDETGERAVVNALALVQDVGGCRRD